MKYICEHCSWAKIEDGCHALEHIQWAKTLKPGIVIVVSQCKDFTDEPQGITVVVDSNTQWNGGSDEQQSAIAIR